jgi:hypothetical protein
VTELSYDAIPTILSYGPDLLTQEWVTLLKKASAEDNKKFTNYYIWYDTIKLIGDTFTECYQTEICDKLTQLYYQHGDIKNTKRQSWNLSRSRF